MTPLEGAGPLRVTVAVELFPPTTVDGFKVTERRLIGFNVSTLDTDVPFRLALIVADVFWTTTVVFTTNVAVVFPPLTVTFAGTSALEEVLDNVTAIPDVGAAPLSVTVPVDGEPPVTVAGLTDMESKIAGLTVKVELADVTPNLPVTGTCFSEATPNVLTTKVAVEEPAGIVTDPGTDATVAALLESRTTVPPFGAIPVRVTIPVDEFPPTTEVGLTLTESTPIGFIVSAAETVTVLKLAEIFADVRLVTGLVNTVKVPELCPAGTEMVAGTFAAFWSLAKLTTTPPGPAGPLKNTVPVEGDAPATVDGSSFTETKLRMSRVRIACKSPFKLALIGTNALAETPCEVIGKVAVVCPPATVTEAGTVTNGFWHVIKTDEPEGAAGPRSLTTPVLVCPPTIKLGVKVKPTKDVGVMLRFADFHTPTIDAVTIETVHVFTPTVVTLKVPVFDPFGMKRVGGTVAAGSLLVNNKVTPCGPAGPLSVTVAVEVSPPTNDSGDRTNEVGVAGLTVSVVEAFSSLWVPVILASI